MYGGWWNAICSNNHNVKITINSSQLTYYFRVLSLLKPAKTVSFDKGISNFHAMKRNFVFHFIR